GGAQYPCSTLTINSAKKPLNHSAISGCSPKTTKPKRLSPISNPIHQSTTTIGGGGGGGGNGGLASSPSLSMWRRSKELGKEGLIVAKELERLDRTLSGSTVTSRPTSLDSSNRILCRSSLSSRG
ncbi:hypothetical protein Dimus_013704, partial [Dionaea muscipula]